MSAFTEVDDLIWYCRACHGAYKSKSGEVDKACKCERPVEQIQPTRVTQIVDNRRRRHVSELTEREVQVRANVRIGARVRVTFEATIDKAWYKPKYEGDEIIEAATVVMIVDGPNGHPLVIDTGDESVIVERVTETVTRQD